MKNLDREYTKAIEHVKEVKAFYVHLGTYVVVIGFLAVLNMMTSPGYLWFKWPMLGWGIGVAFQALNLFGFDSSAGRNWEEKKIRQYMGDEEYKKAMDNKKEEI